MVISRALTGDLPCAFCGYELRGLSVEGRCPECGTLIRATILYTVDPEADELRAVTQRHAVSIALVVWAAAGLAAVAAAWIPRVADVLWRLNPAVPRLSFHWSPRVQLIGIAASGLAMLALIRPVRRAPWRESVLAACAALLYIPLYLVQHTLLSTIDMTHSAPYLVEPPLPIRIVSRLISTACVIGILLAFRPTARRLVRRSLALRTGRVDRQTILAMVGALGITAVGDLIRLVSLSLDPAPAGIAQPIGSMVVLVGSGLLTLGFVNALVDCWRIRRSIMIPSPSLSQVMGHDHETCEASCQPGSRSDA